jgi:methyl-galactoside transport system substrate-binding protein
MKILSKIITLISFTLTSKIQISTFAVSSLDNSSRNVVNVAVLKNVPLVLMEIDPQVISKVSKDYDKVAFATTDSKLAGINEGNIIVNLWNTNKKALDKNGDNILQYVLLQEEVDNEIAIERTKSVLSTINYSGIKTQQLALVNVNWSKELAMHYQKHKI